MKLFNLDISTLVLRFYLLMAIVIIPFFIGMPWLTILALPVFFISLLGMTFSRQPNKATQTVAAPRQTARGTQTQTSF